MVDEPGPGRHVQSVRLRRDRSEAQGRRGFLGEPVTRAELLEMDDGSPVAGESARFTTGATLASATVAPVISSLDLGERGTFHHHRDCESEGSAEGFAVDVLAVVQDSDPLARFGMEIVEGPWSYLDLEHLPHAVDPGTVVRGDGATKNGRLCGGVDGEWRGDAIDLRCGVHPGRLRGSPRGATRDRVAAGPRPGPPTSMRPPAGARPAVSVREGSAAHPSREVSGAQPLPSRLSSQLRPTASRQSRGGFGRAQPLLSRLSSQLRPTASRQSRGGFGRGAQPTPFGPFPHLRPTASRQSRGGFGRGAQLTPPEK